MAASGATAGLLHDERAREDVPIVLRLPRPLRGSLRRDPGHAHRAAPVAVGELTRPTLGVEEQSIYHKNLQPVTYITGDVAGALESPVYAILQMNRALSSLEAARGIRLEIWNTAPAVRQVAGTP